METMKTSDALPQPRLRLTEPLTEIPRLAPRLSACTPPGYNCTRATTQSSSFEAILDAYANDPDRWDGLE